MTPLSSSRLIVSRKWFADVRLHSTINGDTPRTPPPLSHPTCCMHSLRGSILSTGECLYVCAVVNCWISHARAPMCIPQTLLHFFFIPTVTPNPLLFAMSVHIVFNITHLVCMNCLWALQRHVVVVRSFTSSSYETSSVM